MNAALKLRSATIFSLNLIATLGTPAPLTPAVAQLAGLDRTPAAYGKSFEAWTSASGVKGGIIVVNHNRRVVHESFVGGADPASAVLLGSLSKAITATCVARLIDEGRLTWATRLKDALNRYFQTFGSPADPRVEAITIEQLVLHRAGFITRPQDALTTLTLRAFLEKNTAREPQFGPLLAATLRHPLALSPGERYAYSNAGYLALGAVVEEATNESYETACRSRVLTPLGVKDGRLDPSWRVLSSYGGWFMSGSDYLRFFEIFAPEHRLLSRENRAWLADRTGKVMNPPAKHWYGLGVRIDPATGGQAIISHTGAWPWTQPVSKDGSLAASTGAFVARYPDGTSLFTAFWPIPRDVAERDLAYNKLVEAMRGANERAQRSSAAH